MAVLRVQAFSGVIPVAGDRALPEGFATESVNTWLYGQELRGIRPPVDVIACNTTTREVLRIPKRTVGGDPTYPTLVPPPSYLGDSVWKQFTDIDTDILRGQLIEDSYERYYFCSPTTGPMYNTYDRMVAGASDYKLGVPGPDVVEAADGTNPDRPIVSGIAGYNKSEDIYEIEFKLVSTAGGTTAYTNAMGQGNRTATIAQTGAVTFEPAGELLVDGNKTTGFKITNLSAKNKTIVWDFTTAQKIDEFKWFQKGDTAYGGWKFQGSTDASAWVDLREIYLGGTPEATYGIPNSTVYRYYRLFQAEPTNTLQITRAYVYTWVNMYGEESAPSLPGSGAGDSMGSWTITNIKDPPDPPVAGYAPYHATKTKRLYRTVTGASGQTTYYKVADIPVGTTTYVDDTYDLTDAEIVLNLRLESITWSLPPATLKGWIAMPNGFLIGFDGSNIYMSEAYRWHAWPGEYKQATETPVVGLGVLGQTCVVCTQGYPSTITGTKPATCTFTKSTADEPCLSRGSIVSTPQGVIYASQNGLVQVGPSGIGNVTEQLITRQEWIRSYAPEYLRGVRYQNGYLAMRMYPVGATTVRSGFYIDPTALKVALTDMSDFELVRALNTDFWSGEVFQIVSDGVTAMIRRWDPPTNDLMPVRWQSKEFQFPFKENFATYAIYWDDARYSNVSYGLDVLPTAQKVRFKVLANRAIVYDQEVPINGAPIRLPSGFKSDVWQFEIRARAPIYSLHVASTVKELKAV